MTNDKLKHFIQDHRDAFDGESPPAGLWDRIETSVRAKRADTADPLEEFILKNREEFDTATPPPRLSARVMASVAGNSPRRLRAGSRRRFFGYVMGIAASLLLLFAAYNFGNRAGYRAGQEGPVATNLETLNPELAEAERFYQQRISSEFTKVSQVNDDPQLRRDLKEIDAATAQIREQLLEVPVSQRQVLVNQLIATYRTKLDILLRIQQHFNNPNATGGPSGPVNQEQNEI